MQDTVIVQSELLSVFNALPGIAILLQPDAPGFTIIAATDDYLASTFTRRDDILGRELFEIFGDHPGSKRSIGIQTVSASLLHVVEHKQPHLIPDIRFDVYNPSTNEFEFRVWRMHSKPVLDANGDVQYIIHHVEDRTGKITIDATEQAENIKRLEQSEQQVRALIESAPFPIGVYIGREMRIQFANQSIKDVWGKGDDIIGKTYFEVLPELEEQQIYQQLEQVYNTGIALHKRNQRVDLIVKGQLRSFYFNYSFTPLFDNQGKVYGVMNTAADVTDLVMAKQQVEQSERNFRSMILQTPVAMCILLGPDHVVDLANEKIIQIWGKDSETVVGKPIFEGLADARDQGFEQLLSEVYHDGVTHKFDEHAIQLLRNGKLETAYLNFVYQPYKDAQGNILGVLAIANEVTEQVLSRQKIEQNREELEMAIAIADLGTFRIDLVNNTSSYSKRIMDWFGFDEQGMGMLDIPTFVHDEDRPKVIAALTTSYTSEENSRHDFTYRVVNRKTGVIRHLHSFGKTYFTPEGKPYVMIGMIQDITPQVSYQQQLEESEEELQARITERTKELESQRNLLNNILVSSSNGISVTEMIRNESGKIVDLATILANDAAVKFTGLDKDTYLTKTVKEIDPEVFDSDYGKICMQTLTTGQPSLTQYFLESTGKWLELTVSKMDDDHLIQIFTDITPAKETQLRLEHLVEDLKRSNANLEEFAYAASHDMQEPIRKIQFFSDRLQAELGVALTERQQYLFQRLQNASDRMRTLIDDLLAYSRVSRGSLEFTEVDLSQKLQLVLGDLELQVQEKHAQVMAEALPVVRGNSRQLQQLLQNLLNNALKYSKEGENPRIDIFYEPVKGMEVKPELSSDEGNRRFHHIIIRDNGIGFRQDDSERIFNIFTRLHGASEYRGTGVGLSIARKVVENHKGYIWADSEPGQGAAFNILLPV
ncbi:MAG: PAS domain S-box protein [Flavisolibacter sp.]